MWNSVAFALAAPRGDAGTTTLDWWNFGLAVLGIVLTVGGFIVAIVQINKTKSAADAAAEAATVGTTRIRYNQLIILVPQLQSLELEMDNAVRQADVFTSERVLVRWRQIASQALGILRDMAEEHRELAETIDKACTTAITAKGKLPEVSAEKPLASLTSGVRKELSAVNDRLGALLGALATQVGTEAEEKK